jgi:hypothetical protein
LTCKGPTKFSSVIVPVAKTPLLTPPPGQQDHTENDDGTIYIGRANMDVRGNDIVYVRHIEHVCQRCAIITDAEDRLTLTKRIPLQDFVIS